MRRAGKRGVRWIRTPADEDTEPAVQERRALDAAGTRAGRPSRCRPPISSRAHLKGLIEALVFVADQPLSLHDIAKAAGRADRKLVKALSDELRQDYARRGIHLDEVAGGLIFRTNPAYAPFIRDAVAKKPVRMTRAQLETLSIIAYRQPLTRPEVDDVRGVDSGPVMKMLLERDLIKILGKKDEPGRPLLYGTTPTFLEFFGLKALKDLPSLREFTELNDDSRRAYEREMEGSPDAPTTPDLATLAAAASAAVAGGSRRRWTAMPTPSRAPSVPTAFRRRIGSNARPSRTPRSMHWTRYHRRRMATVRGATVSEVDRRAVPENSDPGEPDAQA